MHKIATTKLNSTQSWVGLIFLRKTKPQTTKPKLTPTFSQLLHNQARPNSVCNLISTQVEDSWKKIGPPPKKKILPKFSKFDFEQISIKFSVQLYFNLN